MNWKKLIAPIVITAVLVLYLAFYFGALLWLPGLPTLIKVPLALVPLFGLGVAIYNLIERIKEIRSGEEDDLDNY